MKRKSAHQPQAPRKKQKKSESTTVQAGQSAVLAACYGSVLSLREYLVARLPVKCLRRKHLSAPVGDAADALLDRWQVGVLTDPTPELKRARSRDLAAFTQTQRSHDGYSDRSQTCRLEEVLDYVVWHLFEKTTNGSSRPRHLLCNGLHRGVAPDGSTLVRGVMQLHPSDNLAQFKTTSWYKIFAALGVDGECILTSLLLDCGVYTALDSGAINHYQVSGVPIIDLKNAFRPLSDKGEGDQAVRRPSSINFVRSRMLYAKPSLNKLGQVRFGLKHIHVLERCANLADGAQTIHITKHIFPRQFRLHNVFTSIVDKRQTSQPFVDYLYRENEILADSKHPKTWLPPRLRGPVLRLVQKLRVLHGRCAYTQLLRHYCSLKPPARAKESKLVESQDTHSSGFLTQTQRTVLQSAQTGGKPPARDPDLSFLEYATPTPQVSAFCRAVLWSVLPKNAFGEGDDGRHNWPIMMSNVDLFVRKRRFETMSLDQVCQRLRLGCLAWLAPAKMSKRTRLSKLERGKRLEILREFVYYLFDSLLIPLIQSNFYVTETGSQRNRLFYFRHDVWRKMAEPSLAMIRSGVYQQLTSAEVRHLFNSRALGYSHIRLLPKDLGTRTITNLKRRMTKVVNGKRLLGPSINAQLAPVFSALSFERMQCPERLGGAIFSVGGLHTKLKDFKNTVGCAAKLYFVKVDVQSCFDSIPQSQLLAMIQEDFRHSSYRTTKYVEAKPAGHGQTRQKFLSLARAADTQPVFSAAVADQLSSEKGGRVFVEVGMQKVWMHKQLMALLREHVQNNVVKIGKRHFRQREGIPQGSVLSSALCSFFYSAFERDQLGFLDPKNSMLVRLIDDFLLITTDKRTAKTFLQVMTQPHEQYGIAVNPQKTLTNFEAAVEAHKIPRHQGAGGFPYCGMTIDVVSLDIGRDRQRKDHILSNGLTVDLTKRAGASFRRKVRLSFVQQMHKMLLDVPLNSPERVFSTLLESFSETLMKMHAYLRSMPRRQQPNEEMLMQVADELLQLGMRSVCQPRVNGGKASESTILTKRHVVWALSSALEHALGTKQSKYRRLLQHFRTTQPVKEAGMKINRKTQRRLARHRDAVFRDCVY